MTIAHVERLKLVTAENAQLQAELGALKDRVQTLERIATDELSHSRIWEGYTKTPLKPNRLRVWFVTLVAKLLGFTLW